MIARWDRGLLLAIIALVGVGLVQVYSSSYIFAIESYGDGLYFFKRQLFFAAISLSVLMLITTFSWKWIEKMGWVFWGVAALLVGLTFIPGIGVKVGGAARWLQLPGGFRFQPGEFLNVSFSLLIATFWAREERAKEESLPLSPWRWLVRFLIIAIPLVALLKQPDFGTFTIILIVGASLLFVFGMKWRYIIAGTAVALPAFYFLVMNVAYRKARVLAFLDPWADPGQKGFQVIQSMLSYHSGGITGVGLGKGQGKLFFLPEAHTDFTLSVLAEEMGFIGLMVILLMYGFLIFRGFQIAMQSRTPFRRAASLGLSMCFSMAVTINVGVTMGLLPTKGLALPFLSYGGSSLLNICILFGFLLSIDRANREEKNFSVATASWTSTR